MIDYVEIRGADTKIEGIIDVATSIIWRSVFFGVGDFEIYVKVTPENIGLLKVGKYVTRPDNDEVGIIESININSNDNNGIMITASGRFAKSILDRRLIYSLSGSRNTATVLSGNVENAVREVVANNAIACNFDSKRNIPLLVLGLSAGIPLEIVDDDGNAAAKQVTSENLMTYTDALLEEYGLSARCILFNEKLRYTIRQGIDRSINNTVGNIPIVFSKEYDNLTESEYLYDTTLQKNTALIGGSGEGVERYYALIGSAKSGLQRREQWIDASSIKRTLKSSEIQEMYPAGKFDGLNFIVNGKTYATLVHEDPDKDYSLKELKEKFPTGIPTGTIFTVDGVVYANEIYDEIKYTLTPIGYKEMLAVDEKEGNYSFTESVYDRLLKSKGTQDLALLSATEKYNGVIDATNGNFVYGRDFTLGDIVTVQDNNIGIYANVRIREAIEVQDENGYNVEIIYQ